MHGICRVATLGGIPPQPDDAHIEGFGELGEASAYLPQTDDKECLAAKLVLPLGEIADHATPKPPCLIITRLGKPAAQCQDQRHRVLGDGPVVDTAGTGEADAALCQFLARELVGAGADCLDEA